MLQNRYDWPLNVDEYNFTVRRYASVVYAVVVCLSVCLSYASIVSKRLNLRSHK